MTERFLWTGIITLGFLCLVWVLLRHSRGSGSWGGWSWPTTATKSPRGSHPRSGPPSRTSELLSSSSTGQPEGTEAETETDTIETNGVWPHLTHRLPPA